MPYDVDVYAQEHEAYKQARLTGLPRQGSAGGGGTGTGAGTGSAGNAAAVTSSGWGQGGGGGGVAGRMPRTLKEAEELDFTGVGNTVLKNVVKVWGKCGGVGEVGGGIALHWFDLGLPVSCSHCLPASHRPSALCAPQACLPCTPPACPPCTALSCLLSTPVVPAFRLPACPTVRLPAVAGCAPQACLLPHRMSLPACLPHFPAAASGLPTLHRLPASHYLSAFHCRLSP